MAFSAFQTAMVKPPAPSYPPGPPGVVIYAIGDIHGRSDCLPALHRTIDRDKSRLKPSLTTAEIYLGDFVDRGPDSHGVLETIITRARKATVVCLKGNHEIMFEAYLAGKLSFDLWKSLGGLGTLLSYRVSSDLLLHGGPALLAAANSAVSKRHREFLAKTHPQVKLGSYCFVHAGIRPNVPLEKQSLQDLTTIRDDFLDHQGGFGFIVVHGHSPLIEVQFQFNRINLDTGAYATNRLSAIRIDENGPTLLAGGDAS